MTPHSPHHSLIQDVKNNESLLIPGRGLHARLLNEIELRFLLTLQEKFLNIKNHNA